ncbi:hypothetical protein M3P05_10510 [Sansalvadorimonas sp. 2012CJ34-2]|uniref:Uncharacterized protein n=1 Tax=Parendozoicomonas callyspongiae TaxID=2942213 RepID=A0ABT0PGH1_9GAMM|nr:hypothetical protein [Sansalvadorimonas sp. 2012CJ34-2]MCL6270351.1 hypothetical protein [Sansalvadorimonas sp. 2012CJ34-2]
MEGNKGIHSGSGAGVSPNKPPSSPAKPRGKSGPNTVSHAKGKKNISSSKSPAHPHSKDLHKRTHSHELDFESSYDRIDKSRDPEEMETLYLGVIRRSPSQKQLAALKELMIWKTADLVAEKYQTALERKGELQKDYDQHCSLNACRKKEKYFKTAAGKFAQFVDAESIHTCLIHKINEKLAVGDIEYTLEQAMTVAREGALDLDLFLAASNDYHLFENLLAARSSEGARPEDVTNQRVYAQLQAKATADVALNLFSSLQVQYGDTMSLNECAMLISKSDHEILSMLENEHSQCVIDTLGFDPHTDRDRLVHYVDPNVLRKELALYIDLHQEYVQAG